MVNSFTLILLINSIVLIGLILNQNESSKDISSAQNTRSLVNPLEKITWVSLVGQLFLLIIQIKITEN